MYIGVAVYFVNFDLIFLKYPIQMILFKTGTKLFHIQMVLGRG